MRWAGRSRVSALAAPSRLFQLINDLSKRERGAVNRPPVLAGPRPTTHFGADYTTALARARQDLFFDREHHTRLHESARRVVNSDRDERAALVEQHNVRAFVPTFRRVADANSRAVSRPARLLDR
jgi:hypothetical protein